MIQHVVALILTICTLTCVAMLLLLYEVLALLVVVTQFIIHRLIYAAAVDYFNEAMPHLAVVIMLIIYIPIFAVEEK